MMYRVASATIFRLLRKACVGLNDDQIREIHEAVQPLLQALLKHLHI